MKTYNVKMKIYYAHCMAIYNTKIEERDIASLNNLGFDVLNPNQEIHQEKCQEFENPMDYFLNLVNICDALAFRSLPTGKIPAGIYKEIMEAQRLGIPIIELPVNPILREMTVEQTRAYLTEVGQR